MPTPNVPLEDVLRKHGLDALRDRTTTQIKDLTGAGERVARRLRAMAQGEHHESEAPEVDPARGRTVAFDDGDDTYTFEWPSAPRPLTLPGSTVRAIVRDYVRDGGNLTQRACAAKHGLTRKEFAEIKVALDLTKDHEPFTDEELAERDVEDLVDETLQAKRRALLAKTERRGVRALEEGARKWAAFEAGTLDPFEEAANRALERSVTFDPPSACPPPPDAAEPPPWALHLHPSDLHVGSLAWEGYGQGRVDMEAARSGLFDATARILRDMPRGGRPEHIILPVGGDWFHMDNTQGRTSSTRNAMDLATVPEGVLDYGLTLALDYYRMLAAWADEIGATVDFYCEPGNHDEMLSRAMFRFLEAALGDEAAGVSFRGDLGPYQYLSYGASVLCLHHGHGAATNKKLAPIIDAEVRRRGWPSRYRYAITGNLHHIAAKDAEGVVLLQKPSLTGSDRYHTLNGYTTATAALSAYGFDRAAGLFWTGVASA